MVLFDVEISQKAGLVHFSSTLLQTIVQALYGWTQTKLQQKVSLQNCLLQGPKSPIKEGSHVCCSGHLKEMHCPKKPFAAFLSHSGSVWAIMTGLQVLRLAVYQKNCSDLHAFFEPTCACCTVGSYASLSVRLSVTGQ